MIGWGKSNNTLTFVIRNRHLPSATAAAAVPELYISAVCDGCSSHPSWITVALGPDKHDFEVSTLVGAVGGVSMLLGARWVTDRLCLHPLCFKHSSCSCPLQKEALAACQEACSVCYNAHEAVDGYAFAQ
jgi:hypothetical protein